MTKKEKEDLSEQIEFLRSEGVLVYKAEGLELTLLPNKPAPPVKEKKRSAEEAFEPKKKGADGLSAEEQETLYGVRIDAEE